MSTPFTPAFNDLAFTLSANYTPGSGVVALTNLDGLPNDVPSVSKPLRLSFQRKKDGAKSIIIFTGRSANTLTGGAVAEGKTDIPLYGGDYAACRFSAGYLNDLASSVNTLETQVASLNGASDDDSSYALDSAVVHKTGTETIAGTKTFSSPISGSVTGSAGSVTGSVPGGQITGNIPGNSASITGSITELQVTNLTTDLAAKAADSSVVHLTGNETVAGIKIFSSTIVCSISGNAATATNGVVTTGSYSDPSWVTALAGSKITGNIAGNAASLTGSITESQVTSLVSDLAAKAPLASPGLTGTPTAPTAASGTNTTQIASTAFVHGAVSDLVNSSPSTLDTLKELADALGDDPSFATSVATSLGLKAADSAVVHNTGNETVAGTKTFSSTIAGSVTGNAETVTNGVYTNASNTWTTNNQTFGDGTGSGFNVIINAAASTIKALGFQSAGLFRWIVRCDNTSEAGANAGANFVLVSRNDDGTFLANVLTITRSSGLATFSGTVAATTFSGSGASLTNLPAANITGTLGTGNGGTGLAAAPSGIIKGNGTTTFSAATKGVDYGYPGAFYQPFYTGQDLYYFTTPSASVGTLAAGGNGNLRVSPFFASTTITIHEIGAEVTATGDSGSTVRLGIWADNGSGYPSTVVLDAGTILGTSATVQTITGVTTTLNPGLYWVGAAIQGVTTTSPTLRTVSGGGSLLPTTAVPTAGQVPMSWLMNGATTSFASFSATKQVSSSAIRTFVRVL